MRLKYKDEITCGKSLTFPAIRSKVISALAAAQFMNDGFRHSRHSVHRAGNGCASAVDFAPLGKWAFDPRERHLHGEHRTRAVSAAATRTPPDRIRHAFVFGCPMLARHADRQSRRSVGFACRALRGVRQFGAGVLLGKFDCGFIFINQCAIDNPMRALIAHAERWLAAVVICGAAAAAVDSALAPVVAGDHVMVKTT